MISTIDIGGSYPIHQWAGLAVKPSVRMAWSRKSTITILWQFFWRKACTPSSAVDSPTKRSTSIRDREVLVRAIYRFAFMLAATELYLCRHYLLDTGASKNLMLFAEVGKEINGKAVRNNLYPSKYQSP